MYIIYILHMDICGCAVPILYTLRIIVDCNEVQTFEPAEQGGWVLKIVSLYIFLYVNCSSCKCDMASSLA